MGLPLTPTTQGTAFTTRVLLGMEVARRKQNSIPAGTQTREYFYFFWLVRTCPNLSTIQWPCTMVTLSFFALSKALILQSYVLTCWNCIFNLPYWNVSSGVRVMELYWNKNVDLSRRLCLKIVNGKRFERRKFLVLRPVLLRNTYFSSANRQLSIDVWFVELC